MVDLAIKIAAFLFLVWVAFLVMAAIAAAGKYILAFVLIFGVMLLITYLSREKRDHPSHSQVQTEAAPTTTAAASASLADRLRNERVELAVAGGSARPIAAIESSRDVVRLIVSFRADSGGRILGNGTRAASLLKPALCLPSGYLSEFREHPERLTLVAYEGGMAVSEQQLAADFCK